MQGHQLRSLPQLNSSLQEEGRSHGSSSSGAVEGGSREQDTLSNEAGTTRGHGGAPRMAGVRRTAVAMHPAKDCQGQLSAGQGTSWTLKLVWRRKDLAEPQQENQGKAENT